MNKKRNWILALILSATAGFFALQNGTAPTNNAPTATGTAIAIETTTFTPGYEGCSFVWAYHDDPELTEKIDAAIRALDPLATANVSLFGEDCVYANGHSTFSTMETDFYVRLPVEDLTNHEAFGNWMKQVLDTILQIPRGEIKGNDGFVDFRFTKSETENLIVHVSIAQYRSEALGMTGADLFQLFYKNN